MHSSYVFESILKICSLLSGYMLVYNDVLSCKNNGREKKSRSKTKLTRRNLEVLSRISHLRRQNQKLAKNKRAPSSNEEPKKTKRKLSKKIKIQKKAKQRWQEGDPSPTTPHSATQRSFPQHNPRRSTTPLFLPQFLQSMPKR